MMASGEATDMEMAVFKPDEYVRTKPDEASVCSGLFEDEGFKSMGLKNASLLKLKKGYQGKA